MPQVREMVRTTYAMVDVYCASYRRPPAAITLDIDDTENGDSFRIGRHPPETPSVGLQPGTA